MGIDFRDTNGEPLGDGSCTTDYWSHATILLPQLADFLAELSRSSNLLPRDTAPFDTNSLFVFDAASDTVKISDHNELTRLLQCCSDVSSHDDYPFFAILVDALHDWTRPQ
ncbi:hypothetical protein RBSH_00027 [Rhodopirellula baltica SH28]|uniref:Uncharacterized protein n=1 Tax=Rhodopirellula baltica SH28 TaxID=993517 RepID=K5DD27_RHOBT|nr:hypothetical protein [Rhodopirellula baltica]EKK04647.1 hypothetical protein RBSH_00027 [Rhodopirellula baltica SH28]